MALQTVEQAVERRLDGGFLYELTEPEKGYLAGLIDGEGCISVEREVRKDRGDKVRFRPVLSVSNTDRAVCEVMFAVVGHGYLSVLKRDIIKNPAAAGWKSLHQWRLKGGSVQHVLEIVRPYLRIKAPQCELVLTQGATETTWLRVKELNFRGIAIQKETANNGINEEPTGNV